jgi:hypothetical protein
MSDTLKRVRSLAAQGKVGISDHGYDELVDDAIFAVDMLAGLAAAGTGFPRNLAAEPTLSLERRTPQAPCNRRTWGCRRS